MSRTIEIYVDSHLRVSRDAIDLDIIHEVFDELTFPNVERVIAKEANRWGWRDMPEHFHMAKLTGDEFIMPRGYALQLKLLLRERNIDVCWRDKRKWKYGARYGRFDFSYRPHQPAAVRAIRRHQQGIYKAPTGSGKSATVCGAIYESHPDYALILVDRINMVDQWVNEIRKHIGSLASVGTIGDGKWEPNRITVATVQTLSLKRDEERTKDFLSRQSFVCLDEMHHVTSDMYKNVVDRCPARIRIGVSATPDKTGVFDLALNTLGEIFYETTEQELRDLGLLVKPRVHVVNTNFSFPYYGDHKAGRDGRCEKPGCNSRKPFHGHRNNYGDCKAALVANTERNLLIATEINAQAGHVQIVITNEIKHVDNIHASIEVMQSLGTWKAGPIYVLTGKQTRKQRESIIKEIQEKQQSCVILATIAGEGFDLPIIDRVHLVFPNNNPGTTRQSLGRGTRLTEGKGDFVAIDYNDRLVRVFAKHFRTRRWKVYEPMDLEVDLKDADSDDEPTGSLVLKNL